MAAEGPTAGGPAPPAMLGPTVQTVRGPVAADALGMILPHEHIFINLLREYRANGLLDDPELMAAELARFAAAGGRTVVDCTTRELGRAPRRLAAMSERTGLHIVMGCGHYRNPYLDREAIDRLSVDALAQAIVDEVEHGVDGTGIRPGIIGEVGCDGPHIAAVEERTLRAAARAQIASGLTLTTHAARWPVGLPQLDLFAAEGVDPRRVVIGHCDMVPDPAYHLEIARRGAFVQFDTINGHVEHEIERRIRAVCALAAAGHLDQVLLSHDVCLASDLAASGSGGYGFIAAAFLPRLRAAGLSADDCRRLVEDNPRRALTGRPA